MLKANAKIIKWSKIELNFLNNSTDFKKYTSAAEHWGRTNKTQIYLTKNGEEIDSIFIGLRVENNRNAGAFITDVKTRLTRDKNAPYKSLNKFSFTDTRNKSALLFSGIYNINDFFKSGDINATLSSFKGAFQQLKKEHNLPDYFLSSHHLIFKKDFYWLVYLKNPYLGKKNDNLEISKLEPNKINGFPEIKNYMDDWINLSISRHKKIVSTIKLKKEANIVFYKYKSDKDITYYLSKFEEKNLYDVINKTEEKKLKAEKNKKEKLLAQKKAEEEKQRKLLAQKKAEEEKQRKLLEQKKAEEEKQRKLLAQKKAEEEKQRKLLEQKKAEEEKQRKLLAQKKAEEKAENEKKRKILAKKRAELNRIKGKKIVSNYSTGKKKYNVTSETTFHFMEATHNLMTSLELLYRAYDENVQADKLKAQIAYNLESKYTQKQKLQSTRSIVDVSTVEIRSKIQDNSQELSEIGKEYYQAALPYAYQAYGHSFYLYHRVKNTIENASQSSGLEGLLMNANEIVGLLSILKDLPQFARNMQSTTKLIFTGAKTKKVKDKGSHSKALKELEL